MPLLKFNLDCGVSSIGWSVYEAEEEKTNDNGAYHLEQKKLIAGGIRLFENDNEIGPKCREHRDARRTLRRKKTRVEETKKLLITSKILPKEHLEFLDKIPTKKNEIFSPDDVKDLLEIRVDAIDKEISNFALSRLLLYFVKHRGYKCNQYTDEGEETTEKNSTSKKKETTSEKEQEKLKMVASISLNKQIMKEKKYRTAGEMLFKDEKFKLQKRNKNSKNNKNEDDTQQENNKNTKDKSNEMFLTSVAAEDILQEVELILNKQKSFNPLITNDFIRYYLGVKRNNITEKYEDGILSYKRSFDEPLNGEYLKGHKSRFSLRIKDMAKRCTFEKGKMSAPKDSYHSQVFIMWQTLNNMKIIDENNNEKLIPQIKKTEIASRAEKENITYSKIRKILCLSSNEKIDEVLRKQASSKKNTSYQKAEEQTTGFMNSFRAFNSIINSKDIPTYDKVIDILVFYKKFSTRYKKLEKLKVFSEEQIIIISKLNSTGFINLSKKAIKKINPFLKNGDMYYHACIKAGYDPTKSIWELKNKGTLLNLHKYTPFQQVTNPRVKRALIQNIKLVNALIKKYGAPAQITIETERGSFWSEKEKEQYLERIYKQEKMNKEAKKFLEKKGISVTKHNIDIIKLWEEQNKLDIYTGKEITEDNIFKHGYVEIDHIIPRSVFLINSYNNKVLTLVPQNRDKTNQTPYEFFKRQGKEKEWLKRVSQLRNSYIKNGLYKKWKNLSKKHITEEDKEKFSNSALSNTSYISRFLCHFLNDTLEFYPSMVSEKVFQAGGMITGHLRKFLELNKVLEKDRKANNKHHFVDSCLIGFVTPSMRQQIMNYYKKGKKNFTFQKPYDTYLQEIEDYLTKKIINKKTRIEQDNVFCSKKLDHTVNKQIHKETIIPFSEIKREKRKEKNGKKKKEGPFNESMHMKVRGGYSYLSNAIFYIFFYDGENFSYERITPKDMKKQVNDTEKRKFVAKIFPNDLCYIKLKEGIEIKKIKDTEEDINNEESTIVINEGYFYLAGKISETMLGFHDNSHSLKTASRKKDKKIAIKVTNIKEICKCEIDILGKEIYPVKK